MDLIVLNDPVDIPLTGMRSYPSPAALPYGTPAQLTNWRLGKGLPETRGGIVKAGSSPVVNPLHATGYCIGADNVTANGVQYAASVWTSTGGSTRYHVYLYNLGTGAWTEWTSNDSASKFGQTTFATGDDGRCSFCTIRDFRAQKDYILVDDGAGKVVIDPTASAETYAATSAVITVPTNEQDFAVVPYFPKFFTVNDQTTTTLTTGDAGFTAADQGTSPNNFIRATRASATAGTGLQRVIQFSAAVDLSDCPQLIIFHDTLIPYWWEIVKLEGSEDGVSFFTIWDPDNPTGKVPVPQSPDGFGGSSQAREYTAFPLDHVAAASRNAVAYFRLTYIPAAPTSDETFDIYGIFGSGKVPGQSFHVVAYKNVGSRANSVGLLCQNILPELCNNLGTATLANARLVNDEALLYSYKVGFLNTSEAERNKGVAELEVYRNDPGDPDGRYTYVTVVNLATWTPGAPGSWAFDSGSALSQRTTVDNTPTSSKDESLVAPDYATTTIPTGLSAVIGARLVVANPGSGLCFSEEFNHFRFRNRAAGERSGFRRRVSGQRCMAVIAMPASFAGLDMGALVTDKNVYLFGGATNSQLNQLRLIADRGTFFPQTVCVGADALWWLDTEYHICRLSRERGLEKLSEYTVQDKFDTLRALADGFAPTAVFNPNFADAEFVDGRYILSYATTTSNTPASVRKSTPIIYETRINPLTGKEWGFMQDDAQGTTITAEWLFKRGPQLYAVGSDRFVRSWDTPGQTQDDAATFSSVITWGLIHDKLRTPFTIRHINVMMDDCASGTGAFTRTYRPSGAIQSSSVVLDVSTTQQWTQDKNIERTSGSEFGGVGCQISMTFSVPGGAKLYGVTIERGGFDLQPRASG